MFFKTIFLFVNKLFFFTKQLAPKKPFFFYEKKNMRKKQKLWHLKNFNCEKTQNLKLGQN